MNHLLGWKHNHFQPKNNITNPSLFLTIALKVKDLMKQLNVQSSTLGIQVNITECVFGVFFFFYLGIWNIKHSGEFWLFQ